MAGVQSSSGAFAIRVMGIGRFAIGHLALGTAALGGGES